MIEDVTYIDFDGVILDSEERMLECKDHAGFHNHKDEKEFDDSKKILYYGIKMVQQLKHIQRHFLKHMVICI